MQTHVTVVSSSHRFINMDNNSFWLMKVNFVLFLHLHISSRLGSWFNTIFFFFFNGKDRDPSRTWLQWEFKSLQFHPLFFHHVWDFAHLLYNLNFKWRESIRWRVSSHNCFHYWSTCRKVQILKTFQSFCPTTQIQKYSERKEMLIWQICSRNHKSDLHQFILE